MKREEESRIDDDFQDDPAKNMIDQECETISGYFEGIIQYVHPESWGIISSWSIQSINLWSCKIKYNLKNTKAEILSSIAIMDRAYQLVSGNRLRETQKIAILLLMNSKEEKGHIMQVNTGEGKTTIISFCSCS